jgi:hypothetical protein
MIIATVFALTSVAKTTTVMAIHIADRTILAMILLLEGCDDL